MTSEDYWENLKKLYADLEEPSGWGGAEVAELSEEKWDPVFAALIAGAGCRQEPSANLSWAVRLLNLVLQRFGPQRPGADKAQDDQR